MGKILNADDFYEIIMQKLSAFLFSAIEESGIMKKILSNKKYSGILWGIFFIFLFMGSALWALQIFRESAIVWYAINSMQRLVFGIVILFVCKKNLWTNYQRYISDKRK